MPELPEVETMRRGILPSVGGTIVSIDTCRCRRRPITILPGISTIKKRLSGRMVSDVQRLGKRVVLCCDDQRLVFEPRMTGLVLVGEAPTREHLRLRIVVANSPLSEILFWDRRGLGVLRLMEVAEYDRLRDDRLGPDALRITVSELRERLANSRRAIKVALLDQSAVAGIGNLYASEILHRARIHPSRTCDRLSQSQWTRIQMATEQVLEDAIRHEGSTLGDGTYRNTLSQAGSYQNQHRVYDRANECCATCGRANIVRVVQAQRSTFFCPRCQRA